uniref:Predicted protein putative n=1 Tax=Albugo laibachii Nc14 TaxID=890382 RepID=F0WLG4_9STRA|nr:predicted protein putative [Albugo laibachii Nc14]|eukprot:CCA22127.1 predicted protein putative [Albugo laibachii Nc14]
MEIFLRIVRQPTTMTAGEAYANAVIVHLVDERDNFLTEINYGSVSLRIRTAEPTSATVKPEYNSYPIVNGIAQCGKFIIDKAGKDYRLSIVSVLYKAMTVTAPFDVTAGPAHTLFIDSDTITAFGGIAFHPQPVVSIIDRGGNIVEDLTASVQIEISKNPAGGQLLPAMNLLTNVSSGHARFSGLYINTAGCLYKLRYTVDHPLAGGSIVETKSFCVQAGEGRILQLIQSPTTAAGGCAFSIQPILKVTDAGGNIPGDDASNLVQISLSPNPYNGKLRPDAFLTAKVQRGVAVFRNLNVDKAGSNYTLLFSLCKKTDDGVLVKKSIPIASPGCDVAVSSPSRIFVEPFVQAFSDGEPLQQQPHVALLDAGDNLVTTSTAIVEIVFVPSMAIFNSVSVNSINAPPVVVQKIEIAPRPSYTEPFGAGTILSIQVTFSDEVLVKGNPTLMLDSSSVSGAATCMTRSLWSRHLLFQYTVSLTDSTNALQYTSTSSLVLNGGDISDRNGIPATLTLPPLGSPASLAGSSVSIDTSMPLINTIQCSTPGNGEYGVGETIHIEVDYTSEVTVYGLPFLIVDLNNIGRSDTTRRASFSGGNNTRTITFLYIVQQGDQAGTLDVQPAIELNDGSIKRHSMQPSTLAASTIDSSNLNTLRSLNQMRIDTTAPKVDSNIGVTSGSVDGVYSPGDVILIQVTFTKPVMVQGLPRLYLESGPIKQPADYFSGNRSFTLTFRYSVASSDIHDLTGNSYLNYRDDDALELNGGSIQRLILHGSSSTAAQLSLAESTMNQNSLQDNARIGLDSVPPSITSISAGQSAGMLVVPGDPVTLSITFTAPVVVNLDSGIPRVSLSVGKTERFAEYTGGSGTSVLTFLYTVRLGDHATQGMTFTSRRAITLHGATIRRKSYAPILDAALLLPTALLNAPDIDPGTSQSTLPESLRADVALGSYGPGHVIRISLTFTDEVLVTGSPKLLLNSQASALYISGSKTTTLTFQYIIGTSDATSSLNKLHDAALVCGSGCNLLNFNGMLIGLTLAGVDLTPGGIHIDTTPPMITRVYSPTLVPSVNNGMFTTGDVVDIIVEWSSPVTILPSHISRACNGPTLFLNTSQNGQRISCRGFFGGDRKLLWFPYVIQAGDKHMDLAYESSDALSFDGEQCSIKRSSSIPSAVAELALPMPSIPFGQWQNQIFRIDTSFIPCVLSITSPISNGIYRCGDVIPINVEFSGHVIVEGLPVLWLNVGSTSKPATYSAGSGSTTLQFSYLIQEKDYSLILDYRDAHSLDTIDTATDHACSILQQANRPSVLANLKLPLPSTPGSLGHTNRISVDGRRPIIQRIRIAGSERVYSYDETITMEIVFSSPVHVKLGQGVARLKLSLHSRGTGEPLNRYADYVGQNINKTTLYFEYTVKRGDYASHLDYFDTSSLTLEKDARILTQTLSSTANIMQDVDIHLNPPGRRLHVTNHLTLAGGATKVTDLFLDGPGNHYRLCFQTKIGSEILRSWTYVNVTHSSVYALRSPKGDILGTSVAIYGDTIVVGSQSDRVQEVISIHSVNIISNVSFYIKEVQEISTRATQRPMVQQILSDAAANVTIDGWFTLRIGSGPVSRRIYYNYHPIQIAVIIEVDLHFSTNTVNVSRSINTLSKCRNPFVWTISFLSTESSSEVFIIESQLLKGAMATIGNGQGTPSALVVSKPTILSGFLTLKYESKQTRPIPFDAGPIQLSTIISDDLDLSVEKITRTQPSAMMELTWIITFRISHTVYEYDQLVPNGEGLIGHGATISTRVVTKHQGPPSGAFQLDVRIGGLPTKRTVDIPVSSTALQVEQVISMVAPMYQVAVTRMEKKNDIIWRISFMNKEANTDLSNGSIPVLQPVTVTKNIDGREQKLLHGSGVEISASVDQVFPQNQDHDVVMPGGSIITYARDQGVWKQTGGPIAGSDSRTNDRFGSSVAIYHDKILVGAPDAPAYADFGSISFICDADAGSFELHNELRRTGQISFNADHQVLQQSLSYLWNVTGNRVNVSSFLKLCSNTPILIVKAFDVGYGIQEVLTVDKSSLYKKGSQGDITIREESFSSFYLAGQDAQGFQAGAAYIFKKSSDGNWNQSVKLQVPAADIVFAREFGASVTIFDTFGVVGAPGSSGNAGRVYIYHYHPAIGTWTLLQVLQRNDSCQQCRFGEAISISGKSSNIAIAVGAPGSIATSGSAFVYDYDPSQNRFRLQQVFAQSNGYAGDFFGCSVALDMAVIVTLVVGSNSGAAIVFAKEDPESLYFTMETVLSGSDTTPNDHFGRSVSVSGNTIMVSALESPKARYTSSDPVQHIRITTVESSPYDSYGEYKFRLSCRKVQDANKRKEIVHLQTQPIDFDVDVRTMEAILRQDLQVGAVSASRTVDSIGVSWLLTFGSEHQSSLLQVEESNCTIGTCTVPRIKTEWVYPPAPSFDNRVYVFGRSLNEWKEQATLGPRVKQPNHYGTAIAIHGRKAVVGSHPDGDVGGAFVFDLTFLTLGFPSKTYDVIEGDTIDISVLHRKVINDDDHALNSVDVYISHDPEGDLNRRMFWNENQVNFNDSVKTKNPSLWIYGKYDSAGLSDYVIDSEKLFFANITTGISQTFRVQTIDDYVLEEPDERVTLRLSSPGIHPSPLGSLWSTLTIQDDGDGGSGTRISLGLLHAGKGRQLLAEFGACVSICDAYGIALVGAPKERMNVDGHLSACGAVYTFVLRSGYWEQQNKLVPTECLDGQEYGASVALDCSLGSIRAIIGSPGRHPHALIYSSQTWQLINWILEARLTQNLATASFHRYGGPRAVGLWGDLAVVGAVGLERIFVYHRALLSWELVSEITCVDRYVYRNFEDEFQSIFHFGFSVSVSDRTIAVGAPLATAHNDGKAERSYSSKGAVYLCSVQAQQQTIELRADMILLYGEFTLTLMYRGDRKTTQHLGFTASARDVEAALRHLNLLYRIKVSKMSDNLKYQWLLTFWDAFIIVPLLQAAWKGYGCDECLPLSSAYAFDPSDQIHVEERKTLGVWKCETRLTAPDGNSGDRFGSSLDLDGDLFIAGAPASNALTTTTWDFETGDLTGWLTTGTAFDQQPTFGDNVYDRVSTYDYGLHSLDGIGQRAYPQGRYWVGTYEARPGRGKNFTEVILCSFPGSQCRAPNYTLPGESRAGSIQGDGPQGKLCSQSFIIHGNWISFKLGGGCDIRVLYAELRIDSTTKYKQTGKCREKMEIVRWDVAAFQGKSAQLCVVDATSSQYWGHINFDDVRFDWDISHQFAATPNAGAAYIFSRKASNFSEDLCDESIHWKLESRLTSTDKQIGDEFSFDVAIDSSSGFAIVSAPGHGSYRGVDGDVDEKTQVGSIYVYQRTASSRAQDTNAFLWNVRRAQWTPHEIVKLQYTSQQSNTRYGSAIDMSGSTLLSGAPWFSQTPVSNPIGQVFAYNINFLHVGFASSIFHCVEGTETGAIVIVRRFGKDFDQVISVAYATEDENAKGITAFEYRDCHGKPMDKRTECHDYQHIAGELLLSPGTMFAKIEVPIVDNKCRALDSKYFTIRLYVLGGEPLLGERYAARVRIDDDDFDMEVC